MLAIPGVVLGSPPMSRRERPAGGGFMVEAFRSPTLPAPADRRSSSPRAKLAAMFRSRVDPPGSRGGCLAPARAREDPVRSGRRPKWETHRPRRRRGRNGLRRVAGSAPEGAESTRRRGGARRSSSPGSASLPGPDAESTGAERSNPVSEARTGAGSRVRKSVENRSGGHGLRAARLYSAGARKSTAISRAKRPARNGSGRARCGGFSPCRAPEPAGGAPGRGGAGRRPPSPA